MDRRMEALYPVRLWERRWGEILMPLMRQQRQWQRLLWFESSRGLLSSGVRRRREGEGSTGLDNDQTNLLSSDIRDEDPFGDEDFLWVEIFEEDAPEHTVVIATDSIAEREREVRRQRESMKRRAK